MKFTVSRSLLADALKKVSGLASTKGTLPILSNVKMEAHGQSVTFTTTDLDLSIVVDIQSHVTEEGAITIPAKLLTDAVSRAVDGDILFEADVVSNSAVVKAGESVFRFKGMSAKDFPVLPENSGDVNSFELPQPVVKNLLRRTSFAMSQDDTRRTLQGVLFSFKDGKMTVVATDGRRLSCAEYQPETAFAQELDFIVPAKTTAEFCKHLGTSGKVEFSMAKSQMVAKFDSGVTLYSKLTDDTYPNWKQVVPKNNNICIPISREDLMSAIDRVGLFTDGTSMNFTLSEGQMKLTSSATDFGDAVENVYVKYTGEEMYLVFNHQYILDILRASDDDTVNFCIKSPDAPIIIKDSQPGMFLVMPLRIR